MSKKWIFMSIVLFNVFGFSSLLLAQSQTTTISTEEVKKNQESASEIKDSSARFDPTGFENMGKKRVRLSLFSLGGLDKKQLEKISDEAQSMYFFENYFQLAYKFQKDQRIALRYSFNYSTAGKDRSGKDMTDKADTRDLSILMTFYDLFEDVLPTNMSYKFQPRMYLPTSEKSKAQGQISSLELENEFKIFTDRYSYIRTWFEPRYYFQKNTTYINLGGRAAVTDMFQAKHGAEYSHNLGKMFSAAVGFEFDDSWSNASPSNNLFEKHETTVDYRLGLEMRFFKQLKFTLGYGQRNDLVRTNTEPSETLTLMTNASIY